MMNDAKAKQAGVKAPAGMNAATRQGGGQRPAARKPASGTARPAPTGAERLRRWFGNADHRYSFLKKALLAGLVVYAWLVIGANSAKDVDFSTIAGAMAGVPGVAALESGDANEFQDRFGAPPEGCEGWLLYGTADHMDVTELMIAKAADEDSLYRLEDAARARISAQLDSFRGYGVNQTELLERAVVLRRGKYLFYCVSESADRWEDAFLSCIR